MNKKRIVLQLFCPDSLWESWHFVVKSLHHNPVALMTNVIKYNLLPFRSFAQFKASAHNHSLMDGYDSHSTTLGTEIDSLNYRVERDGMGRPTERYDKATFVPTDSVGNIAALVAAIQSAKKKYVLVFSGDCSNVPTEALKAAGKKDGEHNIGNLPDFGDIFIPKPRMENIEYTPKSKQEKILKRNPDAREIE